ncbi:MAG: biotin transporter BioY, partial [Anaerolineaceae bacterium]|nr:biotin transporter BioY [Anaerolineaceae bacterium]
MMQISLGLTVTRQFAVKNRVLVNVGLVVLGSWVLAALAQVRIPLPFTPIPITGQTFGVLLIGAALGARLGTASVGFYIVQGLLGLPFFAGGKSGVMALLGPTGGYLIGFVVAAYVIGSLADRGFDRQVWTSLPSFIAGSAVIYLFGALWLSRFIGMDKALAAGVLPFLVVTLLKL